MSKTKLLLGALALLIIGAAYGKNIPVISTVAAKLPGAS